MRTITAEFRINPGKEAEAEEAIKALVAGVDSGEPGTLTYIVHRHAKDPGRILVFEIYEDDDASKAHQATAHYAEFQKAFVGVFDVSTVKVERYERIAAISR